MYIIYKSPITLLAAEEMIEAVFFLDASSFFLVVSKYDPTDFAFFRSLLGFSPTIENATVKSPGSPSISPERSSTKSLRTTKRSYLLTVLNCGVSE